mmetsp:Transcript_4455/g.6009  ORF Transcript_4455/g.6009 Transcript_4455/m.6009 type:complete len:183 (-) Transcript_4455:66-614(-)
MAYSPSGSRLEVFEEEPEIVTIGWFKQKMMKLQRYEEQLWIEKDHTPVFADFIFSLKAKKLYVYIEDEMDTPVLRTTYIPPRVVNKMEVVYFIRNPGILPQEELGKHVSFGYCKRPVEQNFTRGMSDLGVLMKRKSENELLKSTRPEVALVYFDEKKYLARNPDSRPSTPHRSAMNSFRRKI